MLTLQLNSECGIKLTFYYLFFKVPYGRTTAVVLFEHVIVYQPPSKESIQVS